MVACKDGTGSDGLTPITITIILPYIAGVISANEKLTYTQINTTYGLSLLDELRLAVKGAGGSSRTGVLREVFGNPVRCVMPQIKPYAVACGQQTDRT